MGVRYTTSFLNKMFSFLCSLFRFDTDLKFFEKSKNKIILGSASFCIVKGQKHYKTLI